MANSSLPGAPQASLKDSSIPFSGGYAMLSQFARKRQGSPYDSWGSFWKAKYVSSWSIKYSAIPLPGAIGSIAFYSMF